MTTEIHDKILNRLAEVKQEEGQLPQFIELYGDLLQLQLDVKSRLHISIPHFTDEEVSEIVREGRSLLNLDTLELDWPLVREIFHTVIQAFAQHVPSCLSGAGGILDPSSSFPIRQAANDWFQDSSLAAIALANGIPEDILSSIIQATMYPFLSTYSEQLIGLVDQKQWRRRYCPVCRGKPDFAFLDKESGARWLLCSRCGAEWLFQRLECPYCSNNDQRTLSYFTNDDQLYRLYVCDKCRSYIKAIDLRRTEPIVLLPLERILTIDLDKQAHEKGYEAQCVSIVPLEEVA